MKKFAKKYGIKLGILGLMIVISGCLYCCQGEEVFYVEDVGEEVVSDSMQEVQKEEPEGENAVTEETGGRLAEWQEQTDEPETVTVYICGCVKNPGVYSLPAGSRIYELVERAGGFLKKARVDARNQAERLKDGKQYRIISKKQYKKKKQEQKKKKQGRAKDPETTGSSASRVNINTASREELLTLSGIGESKADAILAYRKENGGFSRVEDIMNISGIKDGVFNRIKDKITTGK